MNSFVTSLRVWLLSHLIINGLFSCKVRAFRSQLVKVGSLAVCDRASNSASVLDVVTVFCLLAFHAIAPPKSSIIYSCELLRSNVLSANGASLAQMKERASLLSLSPPYLNAFPFVLYRYWIVRSAALWWISPGFVF